MARSGRYWERTGIDRTLAEIRALRCIAEYESRQRARAIARERKPQLLTPAQKARIAFAALFSTTK